MPLLIELPDDQQPAARLLYKRIGLEKWQLFQAAKLEWEKILPVLTQLGVHVPDPLSVDSGTELNNFDTAWGWATKAKYILLKNGPLPTRKIVDLLVNVYQPGLDYKLAAPCIRGTLSTDSRKGKFARIEWEGDLIYDVVDREKTIREFKTHSS